MNDKLLTLIEKRGVSLTHLAKQTGISKQNLSRILNSNDIKLSQLLAICDALKVSVVEIIGESDAGTKSAIELAEKLGDCQELNRVLLKNSIPMDDFRRLALEVVQSSFSGLGLVAINYNEDKKEFRTKYADLMEQVNLKEFLSSWGGIIEGDFDAIERISIKHEDKRSKKSTDSKRKK